MNGIEKILDKLLADSQTEVAALLAQAQAEADAIKARYTAQADQEQAAAKEKSLTASAERQDRLVRAAEMESRKMILAAKQAILDKAFSLAHHKLTNLPEADTIAFLSTLAARSALTGGESIVLNETDRAAIGAEVVAAANAKRAQADLPASLTLSEETADVTGGLLLRDRKSEVNCTFETLLRLSRDDLAGQAAALLFN